MLDLIASIIVRLLNLIFGLIPISASLWLGRMAGRLVFVFNKKRRLIAYANLRAAFAGERSPGELRGILKRVYQNIAQTFVEILNLTKVSPRYVERYVEIVNFERVVNASKKERGIILLTAHFGDWELSSLVGATVGFPMTVLAREQKMKRLNELLNRLRESKGCRVVRKGLSTKLILRALYNKETVGILADQDAGRNGVFVDFFGRPTSTAPGAFEFSKRTGAAILPNFIARIKGPYHRLFVEEHIDASSDTKSAVQRYMKVLETYVRRYPDQWLWLHKRWKSTPLRRVLVLSDGKAGHLNQALAVAKEIRKARCSSQGARSEDTEIAVVDIKYRNGFSRALLLLCASLANWRWHGRTGCLKVCLKPDSYNSLIRLYADFVVSCGMGAAPVNILASIENNAKNIVVMKPGNISLGKFKLAIVPRHDNVREGGNVVITDIAPNLIDQDKMKGDGERLKGKLALTKNRVIGLLAGGDNPDYALTEEIINKVIDEVSKAADELDAEILATTSRRTPKHAERILKERLSNNPRCKLLVIANENNIEEAASGILYLSSIVLVSAESISMVSEAVSSGRGVVAFGLEKRRQTVTKHDRAIENLVSKGYVRVVGPSGIAQALAGSMSRPEGPRGPRDMELVYEAVRRLI